MSNSVVMLRCHDIKPNTLECIRLMFQQSPHDVYVVFDATDKEPFHDTYPVWNFSVEDYRSSGYPAPTPEQLRDLPTPPRNPCILPIYYNPEIANIMFGKRFPDYQYYWYIEYDVFFNGQWQDFFELFRNSDEDFLGAYLRQYPFKWWNAKIETHLPLDIPQDCIFRFFGCIARFSAQLLAVLDSEYSAGHIGYYELAVPSLCANNGLKLGDLNADERNVYTPLTLGGESLKFAWSRLGQKWIDQHNNMLFHPIR